MKCLAAVLVVCSLVLGISGCKKKQTETPVSDYQAFPPKTAPASAQPAAPVLSPTSAKIGPGGGTLNSSDGKLSISVPAGALTTETEIAIQPAQDASGESFGPVYQLSPEGTTFPQPVTLAWHFSENDLSTTNLDNLIVRTKPANGAWRLQPDVQRDETAHTISVASNHFSQWGLAMSLRIEPSQAKVFAGDSIKVDAFVGETILSPQPPDQGGPGPALTTPASNIDGDDLTAPTKSTDPRRDIFKNAVWSVNGVPRGNNTLGVVDAPITGSYWYEDAAHQPANYLAPDTVPSQNPVTVSFEMTVSDSGITGSKGNPAKTKMIATALVTILPRQDHWVGDSDITQFDGTKVKSHFTFALVNTPGANNPRSTKRRYEILDGNVSYTGPKQTGSGCPLEINPTFHRLSPKEGALAVDISDPKQWSISGGGQAVWPAIYTASCPNGTLILQSPVSAGWWPPNLLQPGATTLVDIVPGQQPTLSIPVTGPMGQGTVNMKYVGYTPSSLFDRSNHVGAGAGH
jgi:hypothetical protein